MCVGEIFVGEMPVTHFRRNVLSAKCPSAKCLWAKCLSAKCPSTWDGCGVVVSASCVVCWYVCCNSLWFMLWETFHVFVQVVWSVVTQECECPVYV